MSFKCLGETFNVNSANLDDKLELFKKKQLHSSLTVFVSKKAIFKTIILF